MRRSSLLLVVVLVAGLLMVPAGTVWACSCAVWEPEQALKRADAIAIGDVVDVRSAEVEGGSSQTVTIEVDVDVKDNLPPSLEVTQDQRSSCSGTYAVGDRFSQMVYRAADAGAFNTVQDGWTTDLCSIVSEEDILQVAEISPQASPVPTAQGAASPPPRTATAGEGSGVVWWSAGGALLLAGIGIGLWLSMRRRPPA